MMVIAAFPSLGKTAISELNKFRVIDADFNEDRATVGMDAKTIFKFFEACSTAIYNIVKSEYYEAVFISAQPLLLENLAKLGVYPILVFPNPTDSDYIYKYHTNLAKG